LIYHVIVASMIND